jgi:hypothetical protein
VDDRLSARLRWSDVDEKKSIIRATFRFETCARACIDSFTQVPYRSEVDANGCEAWVPDLPDAGPVVLCKS